MFHLSLMSLLPKKDLKKGVMYCVPNVPNVTPLRKDFKKWSLISYRMEHLGAEISWTWPSSPNKNKYRDGDPDSGSPFIWYSFSNYLWIILKYLSRGRCKFRSNRCSLMLTPCYIYQTLNYEFFRNKLYVSIIVLVQTIF